MSHLAKILCVSLLAFTAVSFARENPRDALWAAVRDGDPKAVQAALEKGADVNAKNEMGVSALWIAASKGNAGRGQAVSC